MMKLKNQLSKVFLLLFVASCDQLIDILPVDKASFVEFNNKTNIPIYFIADVTTTDEIITPGSKTVLCRANNEVKLDYQYKHGLKDIVKDSAHIYCLDARLVKLPWYYKQLPDTTINKATIARITYLPTTIRIKFPQPSNGFKTIYNPDYYKELGISVIY